MREITHQGHAYRIPIYIRNASARFTYKLAAAKLKDERNEMTSEYLNSRFANAISLRRVHRLIWGTRWRKVVCARRFRRRQYHVLCFVWKCVLQNPDLTELMDEWVAQWWHDSEAFIRMRVVEYVENNETGLTANLWFFQSALRKEPRF